MRYLALARVRVMPGARVRLNKDQAFNARHLVELPAADGFCNVLHPFDFKAGDHFELDGDLPKNLAEPAPEPAAEAKAPKKPAAKAGPVEA
ncbi:MAG: hypothetical protein JNN18_13010 [Rubrivivax sp.]|nr:hypothetical protein [Rubrivivax sp.]